MSSAVAGTLRIKAPYEFGAHHVGPVACELMSRYPDLTIRIDVEHEIVNPVAENYDVVFAMLEAPLPAAEIIIRRVFSLERGLFAAPALLERVGKPRTLQDLARLPLLTGPNDLPWPITTPEGTSAPCRRESTADQFECPCEIAGGPRRAWCAAGHRQLYPRGDRGGIAATRPAGPVCSRSACTRCFPPANSSPPRFDASWMRWKRTPMARRRRPIHSRGDTCPSKDFPMSAPFSGNPGGLAASNPQFMRYRISQVTMRHAQASTIAATMMRTPTSSFAPVRATRRLSAPSCRPTIAGFTGSPAASCATTARPRTWSRRPMSGPSRIWTAFVAISVLRPGWRASR